MTQLAIFGDTVEIDGYKVATIENAPADIRDRLIGTLEIGDDHESEVERIAREHDEQIADLERDISNMEDAVDEAKAFEARAIDAEDRLEQIEPSDGRERPSSDVARALERAHDHFAAALWAGLDMPRPVFVWQRKKGSRGHFHGQLWQAAGRNVAADEISLNPDTMEARSDEELLSTLVHEMCHQWQHHHGDASRPGYHNKEWADEMERIGLMPSSTGEPGGKRVGQKMSHYILDCGAFEEACKALAASGWEFPWRSLNTEKPAKAKKPKAQSKAKYTCPECGANAWAKPGSHIACMEHMPEIVVMKEGS